MVIHANLPGIYLRVLSEKECGTSDETQAANYQDTPSSPFLEQVDLDDDTFRSPS
jgi:hypothetical protein